MKLLFLNYIIIKIIKMSLLLLKIVFPKKTKNNKIFLHKIYVRCSCGDDIQYIINNYYYYIYS